MRRASASALPLLLIGLVTLTGCSNGAEDAANRGACKDLQENRRTLERVLNGNPDEVTAFTAFLESLEEERQIGLDTDTELGTTILNNANELTDLLESGDPDALSEWIAQGESMGEGAPGSPAVVCSGLGLPLD